MKLLEPRPMLSISQILTVILLPLLSFSNYLLSIYFVINNFVEWQNGFAPYYRCILWFKLPLCLPFISFPPCHPPFCYICITLRGIKLLFCLPKLGSLLSTFSVWYICITFRGIKLLLCLPKLASLCYPPFRHICYIK